jgi:hypothetical protein
MDPGMTAAAFRAALADMGLKHYQTAAFLGKNARLIRDWESGRSLIPHPIADRLIWRFFVFGWNRRWPEPDLESHPSLGRLLSWLGPVASRRSW